MKKEYLNILDAKYPPEGNLLFGHPRMMNADRAKIFAPFAALKGHDDAIEETEKNHILLTNSKD